MKRDIMIVVMRAENAGNGNYDFIECPQCKRKLCEKPAVVKVTTIKSEEDKNGLSLHLLLDRRLLPFRIF